MEIIIVFTLLTLVGLPVIYLAALISALIPRRWYKAVRKARREAEEAARAKRIKRLIESS